MTLTILLHLFYTFLHFIVIDNYGLMNYFFQLRYLYAHLLCPFDFYYKHFIVPNSMSDISVLPTKREKINGTEDMAGMGMGPPVNETLVDAVDIPESQVGLGLFLTL